MSSISWVLNVGLTRVILVVNTRDKITVKTGYNSYYPMQLIDDSSAQIIQIRKFCRFVYTYFQTWEE